MNPIPAILVTGAAGAAKQVFVRALLAARPDGEHWAVLDNDNSQLTALQDAQFSVTGINGCLCCTGQLALQTGIVQLLRRSHPQRLVIIASAAAEPVPLQRALQQGYLANAIHVSHQTFVGAEEDLTPPLPAARELRQQQLLAADVIVAVDAVQAAALQAVATEAGLGAKRVLTIAEALRSVLPIASIGGD